MGAGRRTFAGNWADLLVIAVFAALPVFGLASGPAYAGLVFGLAGLRLLALLPARRLGEMRFDRGLLALAGLAILLAFASIAWSIVPRRSLAGAAQLAGVVAGALILVALPAPGAPALRRLWPALAVAFMLGAALIVGDWLTGFRLHGVLGMDDEPSKYNRGILYSLLLVWPVLAHFAARRQTRLAIAVGLAMAITVAVGVSTTAKLALVLAGVAAGLAWLAPRMVPPVLGSGMAALTLGLPMVLRAVERFRGDLAPRIKPSALHRLELWDYMSARVTEHPWLGWGMWGSQYLPIKPEELASYRWADAHGIYPHCQWLELWVDLGLCGALLGLAIALLGLRGAGRLAPSLRPFAYGSLITALVVSCADFQVTTDSWWAALAATVVLFRTLKAGEEDKLPSLSAASL